MAETLTPDLCVIGGGAGGLTVAAAAAALGVPVVLIERHRTGGEGLKAGGVPSMALLAAAGRAALMRDAPGFGVSAAKMDIDFARIIAHVREAVAAVAPNDSAERFAGMGVRVIKGHARFKDRRTVAVGDAHDVRARRFVIATGSTPAVPSIPGLDRGPYLTTDTIVALKQRPDHLIVIGAEAAGLEMAQGFRRLGSEVTVLAPAAPLAPDDPAWADLPWSDLPWADPECVDIVLAQFDRDGIVIHDGAKVLGVAHADGRVTVTFDGRDGEQAVTGSHVLLAAGRKPTIEGLGLDAARVRHDRSGIAVNRKLKTANKRIYAVGDVVAGGPQLTQAARYQAGLVIRNAVFRLPARMDDSVVPRVVRTEPELAQVGLTEAAARRRRIKIRVARWPYHDNDRAQAERTTHGHIKVITDKKGKILGVSIVGAQAGELIAMWSLALAQGLNLRALAGIALPYPSLSDIGEHAAVDFFVPGLTRPWLRRIITWLRIFG